MQFSGLLLYFLSQPASSVVLSGAIPRAYDALELLGIDLLQGSHLLLPSQLVEASQVLALLLLVLAEYELCHRFCHLASSCGLLQVAWLWWPHTLNSPLAFSTF